MGLLKRASRSGLDRATTTLLLAALALAVLHHTDHVLRVDHSGWPFRSHVTPFTYSLLAYPMLIYALFGQPRQYRWRWLALAAGAAFVIFAHSAIESPHMQFTMWAENRSLDQHEAMSLQNIPGIRSQAAGVAFVIIGMSLNIVAVVATIAMLARALHHRQRNARSATDG
jgi:hypothetical protein